MSELRAHPRYAIELDAELNPSGTDLRVSGRTHDISRGGFSMLASATSQSIAPGTSCAIKLALVFSENEFSEQLTLQGTVMWFTRLKAGAQVGVKFDTLDAASSGYLDLFIRFLDEGAEDEPT